VNKYFVKSVDCPTNEKHKFKCPMNKNDFKVYMNHMETTIEINIKNTRKHWRYVEVYIVQHKSVEQHSLLLLSLPPPPIYNSQLIDPES